MKFFVDTANLEEIKQALDTWVISGVTTNPSLLSKEPKGKFEEHVGKIVDILRGRNDSPHLSVEVFSKDPEEIIRQAQRFKKDFHYESLSVKVQIGWNELAVIERLADENVSVNCTACMTVSQAAWAAKAGAAYASLFWGRIRDANPKVIAEKLRLAEADKGSAIYSILQDHYRQAEGLVKNGIMSEKDFDPFSVVERTRRIFDREGFDCEIIAGSIRTIWDVRDAMLAGAHIVTVPPKFFPEFHLMVEHFKTDEVVNQFLTDFEKWLK